MIDRTKHPNIVFKEEFVSVTRNGQTTLEKYCNYYNNPRKPKAGETYYIPAVDSESGYYAVCCENSDEDERRYRKGLVFRTRGKAIALTQKMLTVAKENG
mgnify:CR=1 FL=1